MKDKIPIIAILVIVVALILYNNSDGTLFSTVPTGNSGTCTDSDFGQDIYVKGTVSGGLHPIFEEPISVDQVDECIDSEWVAEFFCEDGYRKIIRIPCPDGSCKNGMCTGGEPGGPLDGGDE